MDKKQVQMLIKETLFIEWYFPQIASNLSKGGNRYFKQFVEQLPIAKISESAQQPFISLIGHIITITKDEDYLQNSAKQAKVKEYEGQIAQMVYELYDLTVEEIKSIENFNKHKFA